MLITEESGRELKGSEVRYERIRFSVSSGKKPGGTFSPRVTSNQKQSALASNKHYPVKKSDVLRRGERARERGAGILKGEHALPRGSVLCAGIVKTKSESHFELT